MNSRDCVPWRRCAPLSMTASARRLSTRRSRLWWATCVASDIPTPSGLQELSNEADRNNRNSLQCVCQSVRRSCCARCAHRPASASAAPSPCLQVDVRQQFLEWREAHRFLGWTCTNADLRLPRASAGGHRERGQAAVRSAATRRGWLSPLSPSGSPPLPPEAQRHRGATPALQGTWLQQ